MEQTKKKVIQIGRIANDPEFRTTQSGIKQCTFRLAVRRRFANAQGERESDFHTCVAWRNNAEFIEKYLHKGDLVAVEGSLQNRSYEAQDGTKRFVTEIMVDNVESCGGKREAQGNAQQTEQVLNQAAMTFGAGFVEVTDEALPF